MRNPIFRRCGPAGKPTGLAVRGIKVAQQCFGKRWLDKHSFILATYNDESTGTATSVLSSISGHVAFG